MRKNTNTLQLVQRSTLLLLLAVFLIGCGAAETGSLEIRANGEDFVRQGFVSKDGWSINFESLNVNLDEIKAYQTDGGFDAASGDAPSGTVAEISGVQSIDLAAGDADAEPILVETVTAEVGQYDAISWTMVNGDDGATLRMVGSAEKDGQTVDFYIAVEETYAYACGEFVGDERKGFVDADASDDVEMTFHFDHVFGDADSPADDSLNVGALGFDPLAQLAQNGQLNATAAELRNQLSAEDAAKLTETLATLGHVGEGHCYEATGGYTDKE